MIFKKNWRFPAVFCHIFKDNNCVSGFSISLLLRHNLDKFLYQLYQYS
jgi:hypothetical protein